MPEAQGSDTNNETVLIANRINTDRPITGWTLSDDDGGSFTLSGSVPASGVLTVQLDSNLQLGNGGDTIVLKDQSGNQVHSIINSSATAGQFVLAE